MPSGSNASGRRSGQPHQQLRRDGVAAIAAGGKSMKRVKRVADRGVVEGKKRFVGVRQRPSGRWVAEIKDTTQKIRLWLGTFDSAEEGAKAYDNAARALRGANTRTNFVEAITSSSSCDSTEPAKAARLIRLRQSVAATAATTSPSCELLYKSMPQHEDWDSHSQEDSSAAHSAVTSESLSDAIHHGVGDSDPGPPSPAADSALLHEDHQAATANTSLKTSHDACGGHDEVEEEDDDEESFPCATNRADEEASSFVDGNEATDMPSLDQPDAQAAPREPGAAALCNHEDLELDLGFDPDPLDLRNNATLDMIPWPEYVLMEGLDLTCETSSSTGEYPAFEFSAEAMDRDSEQYLSDDSSDFLMTLQPISHHSAEFQAPCELYPPAALCSIIM